MGKLPDEAYLEHRDERQGYITICPASGGNRGSYMRITVHDRVSDTRVVSIVLDHLQFGQALSGRAHVPVAITLTDHLERLGKSYESKQAEVQIDVTRAKYKEDRLWIMKRAEEENPGWTCTIGESTRLTSRPGGPGEPAIYSVILERWV